jgi:hypothetical protein
MGSKAGPCRDSSLAGCSFVLADRGPGPCTCPMSKQIFGLWPPLHASGEKIK